MQASRFILQRYYHDEAPARQNNPADVGAVAPPRLSFDDECLLCFLMNRRFPEDTSVSSWARAAFRGMRLKAAVGHLMKSSTGGLWELERIAASGQ